MDSCQVIEGYYLVIGGGKIGTDFLRYARKNEFPFVLIIDKDENAPASREARVLKTEKELTNSLSNKALTALSDDEPELSGVEEKTRKSEGKRKRESKEKNDKSEFYFYKMDMQNIPSLFTLGIPEYIIPAVPCHAIAYMLADFLKFFNPKLCTG